MFHLSEISFSERLQQTHRALHPATGIEDCSRKPHLTLNDTRLTKHKKHMNNLTFYGMLFGCDHSFFLLLYF